MKKIKKVLVPDCFLVQHSRMSSQTLNGIQTIQNEIYHNACNNNEEYTHVSMDQNDVLHQRCWSKSSGTSSVDTFTLKARMENLEIALTMLRENFQRMEQAMNKQIEKAIEMITSTTSEQDAMGESLLGTNERFFMKKENKRLTKAVKFLTESSRIMRTALSEHTGVIEHLTFVINQPMETIQISNQGRNESPVERMINKCKKQKEKIQIVYPTPVNPLEVSEYFSVDISSSSQPPCACCHCKTSNLDVAPNWPEELLEKVQEANDLCSELSIDKNTSVKCNCRICSLKVNALDPDGDYVTLIQDCITIGQCNQAFQYYNKSSLPDVTTHCNVNSYKINDDDNSMFNEKEGTLV